MCQPHDGQLGEVEASQRLRCVDRDQVRFKDADALAKTIRLIQVVRAQKYRAPLLMAKLFNQLHHVPIRVADQNSSREPEYAIGNRNQSRRNQAEPLA